MTPAQRCGNGALAFPESQSDWRPYVWQDGGHVLILVIEPVGWVVAELRFDSCRCQYVETHRAIYHWAREAFGAFMARTMGAGGAPLTTVANDLSAWVAMRAVKPSLPKHH
ncbi:MAG: hypothetical protein ACR2LS_02550 [Thermomicrobiales bacterium]